MRIPIRGINTVYKTLADGTRKPYYYHRATGKRLDGVPNSPEFIAATATPKRQYLVRRPAILVRWSDAIRCQPNLRRTWPPPPRPNIAAC